MTVVKVPQQFRFGVISYSQKVKIQEEILKEIVQNESEESRVKYDDPIQKCESLVIKHKELSARLKELEINENRSISRVSTAISDISIETSLSQTSRKSKKVDFEAEPDWNKEISKTKLELTKLAKSIDVCINRAKRRTGISTGCQGDHVRTEL